MTPTQVVARLGELDKFQKVTSEKTVDERFQV